MVAEFVLQNVGKKVILGWTAVFSQVNGLSTRIIGKLVLPKTDNKVHSWINCWSLVADVCCLLLDVWHSPTWYMLSLTWCMALSNLIYVVSYLMYGTLQPDICCLLLDVWHSPTTHCGALSWPCMVVGLTIKNIPMQSGVITTNFVSSNPVQVRCTQCNIVW